MAGDQFGNLARYDGSSWTMSGGSRILAGPVAGVSCPTTTFCTAVDDTGHATTSDGTGWSTPTPTSLATAMGVTCTGSSSCLATGTGTGTTTAASWNGTSWLPVSVPLTDALHASCPVAGQCVITGTDPVGRTAMVVWDQGRSSMSVDSPADSQWPLPLSCPTSTFCMLLDDGSKAYPVTG